jgi:hypothetical protein
MRHGDQGRDLALDVGWGGRHVAEGALRGAGIHADRPSVMGSYKRNSANSEGALPRHARGAICVLWGKNSPFPSASLAPSPVLRVNSGRNSIRALLRGVVSCFGSPIGLPGEAPREDR